MHAWPDSVARLVCTLNDFAVTAECLSNHWVMWSWQSAAGLHYCEIKHTRVQQVKWNAWVRVLSLQLMVYNNPSKWLTAACRPEGSMILRQTVYWHDWEEEHKKLSLESGHARFRTYFQNAHMYNAFAHPGSFLVHVCRVTYKPTTCRGLVIMVHVAMIIGYRLLRYPNIVLSIRDIGASVRTCTVCRRR